MTGEEPEGIVVKRIREIVRVGWTELGLGSLGLIDLPEEICQLTILRRLILSDNKLSHLPREIINLKKLEELSAPHNEITRLPLGIEKLTELTKLDFSQNKIQNLSAEIGQLSSLKKLDLRENLLTEIPSEIGNLTNLTSLDIACNKLSNLPNGIGKLKNLRELNASNLAWNGRIEGKNSIKELPFEISQLKKLEKLDLRGNPIAIPPEILEKYNEPEAIINFYFSLRREAGKSLNQIKLIILGQGSVGKTSLVQSILYNNFDQNQDKTECSGPKNLDSILGYVRG
jgi:internalin A